MSKQIQIVVASIILLTGCTTVPTNLGIDNGKLAPCSTKPNCVNSLSQDKKHTIEPIFVTGTPVEVKNDILKIVNQFKNTKIIVTEVNYIRAEFTSSLFGFVDDVEFYFPATDSTQITIDVRSASRVGYSDFGVNRKRIQQIRSKFKTLNSQNN